MKYLALTLILYTLPGCATKAPVRVYEEVIEITEVNPNRLTALTKQNLFHLAKVYDLKPFLFTKKINVQSYVIPHSHPVLTLNTRNADKPNHLLATWLHEEFHWWTTMKKSETDKAIGELKRIYPRLSHSTYLHLIVCYFEYRSLAHLLGENEAKRLIVEVANIDKIYPWVYKQVLENGHAIGKMILKNKLLLKPLTVAQNPTKKPPV